MLIKTCLAYKTFSFAQDCVWCVTSVVKSFVEMFEFRATKIYH
jgi:hypothetical protein